MASTQLYAGSTVRTTAAFYPIEECWWLFIPWFMI